MSEMWYKLALLTLFAVLRIHVVRGYFSCNFESTVDPLCSCYQDTSDNFDWKLDTANTQRSFTRPMVDHTYANRSGHYVFIESSFPAQGSGSVSRFMSPTVFAQNSDSGSNQCLQFYFHMHGPPSQNFHVFIRQHGQAIPEFSHWNRSGDLGDMWYRAMLNMTVSGGFQIIFEGTKGAVFHGDISLDDISIVGGPCEQENTSIPSTGPNTQPSTQLLYEFECHLDNSNLCGFTHDPRNAFNWQWRGNTSPPPLGPLGDHTSGSTSGSYMFVSTDSANQKQEQRSRIISPLIARNTVHKCLRFFKFLNGNNVGELNAYVLLDNVTLPLVPTWGRNMSLGHIWQPGFMAIPPQQSNYRFVFEIVRGADYDATVAIDDLVLRNDLCPTVNASSDFESGLQDFIQDDTDDRNWVMKSGRTASYYTGPTDDHTYGNTSGHFLYIETSGRTTQGHVARLLSPILLATNGYPRCLTFWYHMFGADVEALNIYIVNKTTSDKHDVLWSRSGNRGHRWRAAEVHLQSSVDFQVVFEAEQGDGYQGDIAIDDIKIEADVCPGEHHYHNYSSITCDFEEPEICYYEQDKSDSTDWVWVNGDSGGLNTGPSTDHTTKNELGFYLFISYGNANIYWWFSAQKLTARLISPFAEPQKSPSCVEFWYYMYGKDTEKLNVYIQKENEDIPDEASWSKSGDQGNFWHRATMDINMINTRFRIILEGTTGTTSRDTIALDDITFYNSTSCPIVTTEPPPPITMPPTRNNASCNFEDMYMCNYTQIVEDDYDWSRRQGFRFWWYYWGRWTGPERDHTLGTDKGYYMNFDCDWYWVKYDHRAQLATPYLATHNKPRCLHFYYHMYGYGVDFFNLYVVPFGYTLTVDPTLAIFGNKGDEWHHGTLDLPPSSLPYRVIFEASKGWYSACDIAIDDISFTEGACTKVQPTPAPVTSGNCDFEPTEDPLCGYIQDTKYTMDPWGFSYLADDFDWSLNVGNTSSAKTGPNTDHTLGTAEGHYLYIESSLPKRPLQKARIISPVIEGSKDKMCVQFYHHMKGDGIGNLRLIEKSESSDEKELFKLWGEQGDDWQAETVELEPSDKQFQLVFEGSIRKVPSGDIAIDDITILRQPCQGHLKESICTFDVAGDWCGYTQSSDDDMDWEWYDTNNVRRDPPIENKGDRSYIYVTTSTAVQTNIGQIAQIASRTIDGRSSQHCVEFDFFLSQNSSSSKLTIAVIRNDGKQYNIMTILSHQGTEGWTNMRKTLKKEDVGEKFQVVYIAVVGKDSGVIGLDNPSVSLGSCEEDKASSSSSSQNKTSGNNSAVAIFFGILSAVLIIVLLLVAALYLYRKYKDELPAFAVQYKVHPENGNEKKTVPKDLTIDNPLYVSEPAVLSSGVINEPGTNGVS